VLREALSPLLGMARVSVVLDSGPYAGKVQEAALAGSSYLIVPSVFQGIPLDKSPMVGYNINRCT